MFIDILTDPKGCNMTQSLSDPCLLFRKSSDGRIEVIIVVYVDDVIICGVPEKVEEVKWFIKKRVEMVEVGPIDTHLGVNYTLKKDEHGWYFECEMQKYIDDIVKEYESHIDDNEPDPPL